MHIYMICSIEITTVCGTSLYNLINTRPIQMLFHLFSFPVSLTLPFPLLFLPLSLCPPTPVSLIDFLFVLQSHYFPRTAVQPAAKWPLLLLIGRLIRSQIQPNQSLQGGEGIAQGAVRVFACVYVDRWQREKARNIDTEMSESTRTGGGIERFLSRLPHQRCQIGSAIILPPHPESAPKRPTIGTRPQESSRDPDQGISNHCCPPTCVSRF